jgi:alkylation response protein AidB-like acyl-CoA dehydrogenase
LFNLETTAAQKTLQAEIRSSTSTLREIGATSESERKPSSQLTDRILAGGYALSVVDGKVDPLTAVIAASEYAYGDPGAALVIAGGWQPRLLVGDAAEGMTGRLVSTLVYEGFGRAPSEFTTTATRSGSGWVLTGRKEAVLHPGVAAVSLVVAREADSGELAVFRVEGRPDGYHVERDDATEGKLGLRAAHTGSVHLDGVIVGANARFPASSQLQLSSAIGLSRLMIAAIALGSAQASLDYAISWAKERTAFGKPIASYQGVAFVLVDIETAIESARLLLWDTVTGLTRFADTASLETAVARAVARSCAIGTDAGREGVNLLGVHGIVTDHPVERWYRASAALSAIDFDPLAVALEVA